MDVKQYRRQVEADLKKAAASYKGTAAADTKRILADKAKTAKARVDAIDTTDFDKENFDALVEQYLATLGDKNEAVSVRLAVLRALMVARFFGPQFDAYRAQFQATLRQMATYGSSNLCNAALEVLALDKDDYAKELLLNGLKKPGEALTTVAKAIRLLGYDDHSEAVSTVREIFDELDDTAKEVALRMLASDPESDELLSRLLKDKTQASSIRQISAVGLRNSNPDAFREIAQFIAIDDDDYNEIRATTLSGLTVEQEDNAEEADTEFAEKVSKIKTKSTNLRSSVKRFMKKHANKI